MTAPTGREGASTTLEYVFTAGRYHATPWGAHVNEGRVEWPPSPWRVLRALIATGFSRLGWTGVEGAARELFSMLAEAPPHYQLPEGTSGHTRHYMPIGGEKTTKVIDAFLRFPEGARLLVRFPTDVPDSCRALLSSLLRAQGYLGRAEAWVEARLLERTADGAGEWLAPEAHSPGAGFERIELLAPEPASAYAHWRADYVVQARTATEANERAKAKQKGKPFKGLAKKDLERVEAHVPGNPVDALLQDTGTLRREGWSQPPGTRFIAYFRRTAAVVPMPTRSIGTVRRAPTAALLAIASDTRNTDLCPPLHNVLRFTDALHKALARKTGDAPAEHPSWLTGKAVDGAPLEGHRHISLLPLTLGRRQDRIDHVLVVCPMGLNDDARRALSNLRVAFAKDLPTLYVTLAGMADVETLAETVPLLRPSRLFRSLTPFVLPRYLKAKGRDALVGQVQRELEHRGFPPALRVGVEVGGDGGRFLPAEGARCGRVASDLAIDDGGQGARPCPRFRHFVRVRGSHHPPVALSLSLRLEFERALPGPIALGFGAHFGLGLFAPEAP